MKLNKIKYGEICTQLCAIVYFVIIKIFSDLKTVLDPSLINSDVKVWFLFF